MLINHVDICLLLFAWPRKKEPPFPFGIYPLFIPPYPPYLGQKSESEA